MTHPRTRLLYLEPDDEITSIVRRLREADGERVVLVASGRTRATSSAVALRLLAGVAADEGREIALVADPAARTIAAEAGIAGFASVAEANAEGAVPLDAPPPRRAPIHVVRGEDSVVSQAATSLPVAPLSAALPASPSEETQAVRLPLPEPAPRPARRFGWRSRVAVAVLAVLLLASAAAGVVFLPAATIRITPKSVEVGPRPYEVRPEVLGPEADTIRESVEGTASGTDVQLTPASGTVTFRNWNTVEVEVPAGTSVSVDGGVAFTTNESIVVPFGEINDQGQIVAGEAEMGIQAVEPGPSGNVAATLINTVDDPTVAFFLRGFPTLTARLVINMAATAGGARDEQPKIVQEDVDAAIAELTQTLRNELNARRAADADRLYPGQLPDPMVEEPEGLVGRVGEATFELTGSVSFSWPYVERAAAEEAARQALLADDAATPTGTQILSDSLDVRLGAVRLQGTAVTVDAMVSAAASPTIDVAAVRRRIAGMTEAQATDALEDLGEVSIDLWPGWVDRVPGFEFRVEVIAGSPEA